MQRDAVRARIETVREWADEYDRESNSFEVDGCREVAFLLNRAAKLMGAIIGNEPFPPKMKDLQEPTEAVSIEDTREG